MLLFLGLLTAIFLIPAQPSYADDADDLLLYIPAIIAGSPGWVNTKLSHAVPLTYNGHDEELRQCRVVQVEDGYWIAYAKYSSVDEKYLLVLKTNLEGRILIPPFLLTKLTRTDNEHYNYRFALVPREDGGVQILITENEYGRTIVRVDSVCLYDDATDTVLFDSHDTWRQDYSFNGPMGYALGAHTDNIEEVTLRIYLKVMNENFGIGPLYLMDKFRMEWRYKNDHFELKEVIQNPPGYPSFSAP